MPRFSIAAGHSASSRFFSRSCATWLCPVRIAVPTMPVPSARLGSALTGTSCRKSVSMPAHACGVTIKVVGSSRPIAAPTKRPSSTAIRHASCSRLLRSRMRSKAPLMLPRMVWMRVIRASRSSCSLRSEISRITPEIHRPSSPFSGERLTSAGNSEPSARHIGTSNGAPSDSSARVIARSPFSMSSHSVRWAGTRLRLQAPISCERGQPNSSSICRLTVSILPCWLISTIASGANSIRSRKRDSAYRRAVRSRLSSSARRTAGASRCRLVFRT